jgi:hypothetical protein
MKEKNYELLKSKISNALKGWQARNLSLLGKILIYKTFGLSQLTYVLTVIDLDADQYKCLDRMFFNFLWGRRLDWGRIINRISREKLCKPVELGRFGMIEYKKVVDGIRCRQLGKMFDEAFNHPLKQMIVKEGKKLMSGKCLTRNADPVAIEAYKDILKYSTNYINKLSNTELTSDNILWQQVGEIEIALIIKEGWHGTLEATTLVHQKRITNVREIIEGARRDRQVKNICKKIVRARYLRIIKLALQHNVICTVGAECKLKLSTGKYQFVSKISSKEFRQMMGMRGTATRCKYLDNLDANTTKEYFNQVRRLASTKHKNTLLRVWNGDCLSYSRLLHYGVVPTNECPNCKLYDTPLHMLTECEVAKQVWQMLMAKIPKHADYSLMQYAMGINDSKSILMVKAEILKYLMHCRDLTPTQIISYATLYLKGVNKSNVFISQL